MDQKQVTPIEALEKLIAEKTQFEKTKPEILANIEGHQKKLLEELAVLEKNPSQNTSKITYINDLLCGLKMASEDIHAQAAWFQAKNQELKSRLSISDYVFFKIKKTFNAAPTGLPDFNSLIKRIV